VAVSAVSYLTSLMFGFFTVSCLIILFFFVACLVAERQDGQGKDFGIKRGFYIFPVLILPLSIIAAIFEIQTWRADQLANDMHIASYRSDIVAASSSYQSIGDIMTYPSFRDYYSILYAELLIRAQDLAADQEYVKRSLDLVGSSLSESFSGQMLKAVIYYRLGVNDKADAIFASIQSASRLFPSSYYLQGRDMVRSGDYEKAIWPLYLAQASVPDLKDGRFNDLHLRESSLFLSEIYLSLGQAYLGSGELELARDYFKRSIATNIHQAKAIKGVADSYYLAGDMDGAVKYIIWGRIRFPEDSAWAEALRAIPGK
jgi:tetratricopeptide (TPR) repeat protein